MPIFSNKTERCLGIDIGSNTINIVELSENSKKVWLKNYGMAKIKEITGKKIKETKHDPFSPFVDEIAETIKIILREAGIKTKKSFLALPDFSSFLISFEVPKMKKEEVESAIQYQARQRVPLPLNEVTLDWNLTDIREKDGEEVLDVFLLAVPNETVRTYRRIAEKAGLKVGALDGEIMGFSEIFGKEEEVVMAVNIKRWSTSVNIINDKKPMQSSSLNVSLDNFKENVASVTEISYNQNNKKEDLEKSDERVKRALANELLKKVQEIYETYTTSKERRINQIILTGRGAKIREIEEVFNENLDTEVDIANPFKNIHYTAILEDLLKESGPDFSVAAGMSLLGLRSLEK